MKKPYKYYENNDIRNWAQYHLRARNVGGRLIIAAIELAALGFIYFIGH